MLKLTKAIQVDLKIDVAQCIQAAAGLLLALHQIGWL
jgi:hypothetical protein